MTAAAMAGTATSGTQMTAASTPAAATAGGDDLSVIGSDRQSRTDAWWTGPLLGREVPGDWTQYQRRPHPGHRRESRLLNSLARL
jgi:hypothetical protein